MKFTKPQLAAIEAFQNNLPAGCKLVIEPLSATPVVKEEEPAGDGEEEQEEEAEETPPPPKKKTVKRKTAKKDDDAGEVTLKELRTLAKPLVKDGRGGELKEILEDKYSAESLTALDEDHYAAVKEEIESLLM